MSSTLTQVAAQSQWYCFCLRLFAQVVKTLNKIQRHTSSYQQSISVVVSIPKWHSYTDFEMNQFRYSLCTYHHLFALTHILISLSSDLVSVVLLQILIYLQLTAAQTEGLVVYRLKVSCYQGCQLLCCIKKNHIIMNFQQRLGPDCKSCQSLSQHLKCVCMFVYYISSSVCQFQVHRFCQPSFSFEGGKILSKLSQLASIAFHTVICTFYFSDMPAIGKFSCLNCVQY